MTLYQANQGKPLCLTCQYHEDDTCNFPKRPTAMNCTLYRDVNLPIAAAYQPPFSLKAWINRHLVWIALALLLLVSFLMALLR